MFIVLFYCFVYSDMRKHYKTVCIALRNSLAGLVLVLAVRFLLKVKGDRSGARGGFDDIPVQRTGADSRSRSGKSGWPERAKASSVAQERGNRPDPVTLDFDVDRPLQQRNRDHQSVVLLLCEKDAFNPAQGPFMDFDPLSDVEEGPRGRLDLGLHYSADCQDVVVGDGKGVATSAHDVDDPNGLKDGKPTLELETAKDVAWVQRLVQLDRAVGPDPL
jgi:hypothetical protein